MSKQNPKDLLTYVTEQELGLGENHRIDLEVGQHVIFKQREARHLAAHKDWSWEYESGHIVSIRLKGSPAQPEPLLRPGARRQLPRMPTQRKHPRQRRRLRRRHLQKEG